MKKFIAFIFVALCAAKAVAQFNTIRNREPICRIAMQNNSRPNVVESAINKEKCDSIIGNNHTERDELIQRYMSVSLPLDDIIVTSPFGNRHDPLNQKLSQSHHGVDLRAHYQPVYAMMAGEVVKVFSEKKGGDAVSIRHGDYVVTYCHLSKILVKKGTFVRPGDVVAVSGNSGTRTTGPHLHFGVKYRGKHINPMVMIDFVRSTREDVLRQLNEHCDD